MLKTFDFRNRFCCVWMTEPKRISSQYVSSASVVKICQTFLFGIYSEYVRIKQFRWDLNGRFFFFVFLASGGLWPSVFPGVCKHISYLSAIPPIYLWRTKFFFSFINFEVFPWGRNTRLKCFCRKSPTDRRTDGIRVSTGPLVVWWSDSQTTSQTTLSIWFNQFLNLLAPHELFTWLMRF